MRVPEPAPPDLAALFQEHRTGLAAAVRGILGPGAEVQEVLQEAFLRVWQTRDRQVSSGNLVGFVFVVTLNLARDHRRKLRRPGRQMPLEEVCEMRLTSEDPPPAEQAERIEAVAAARTAIGKLRDAEKDVFFLRVSGGLPFEAVAENLGIPIGTAKTRMRSALATLRQSLSQHAPFEAGREAR